MTKECLRTEELEKNSLKGDGFSVSPQSLPFVPLALVAVIFLHIIVAVVYHTKRNKDPVRVHYSTADGDGVVSLE
ncbi:hypothetical protein MHYP_G00050230 [Metynnis hypsauchen]